MSSSSYKSSFFTIPSRIMDLPGITMAFLRFYETIFQFWHHGEQCYLSNPTIKERTKISSDSTIQEAFEFFEKHGEMKRRFENGRRFIDQPIRSVEVKEAKPLAVPRPPSRQSETPPLAVARHNKNNINNKNINNNCPNEVGLPRGFLEFWKIFPKKEKKLKAIEIWVKQNLEKKSVEIIAALQNRITLDYQYREHRHIPQPTTYLNGQLWEDEVILATNKKEFPDKTFTKTNEPKSIVKWFNDNH